MPGNTSGTGAPEHTRHRSCHRGPSRSTTAGYPGLCPNPTGAGSQSPPPRPPWPCYYLTLMKLMAPCVSLGAFWEAKLVKTAVWKVTRGCYQGFSGLEVPSWGVPLVKGVTGWFSLPRGRSPAFCGGARGWRPDINQHFLSHLEAPEIRITSA